MVYATSHALHKSGEAPIGVIEWESWKLTRRRRSSLAAESQAMADSVDILNFARLFFADLIHAEGIDLRRPDEVFKLLPEAVAFYGLQKLVRCSGEERLIWFGIF